MPAARATIHNCAREDSVGATRRLVTDSLAIATILSPFGAIAATVLVEIVLAIMLLPIDALTLHFLRMVHARFFLPGHRAVGLGALFDIFHMGLALLQACRFALGQRAGLRALVDALLLVLPPLIDVRRYISPTAQRSGRSVKIAVMPAANRVSAASRSLTV